MKLIFTDKVRDLRLNSPTRIVIRAVPALLIAMSFQTSAFAKLKTVEFTEKKLEVKTELVSETSTLQKQIKGRVVDEKGLAIIGANIVVKGTKVSAQTDLDGNFVISVPDGGTKLVFSYIGMETVEVAVDSSPMKIVLKELGQSLDEVVVVGYGTMKKSKITGSVSKLDNKVLQTGTRSNPASALAGTIAGLRVMQSSGRPGSVPTIILRGGTGFDGSGSPLVMVDGFLRDGFSDINQEDIASIEVLKDASATAIYGARATNGVVLITTKKGKAGVSNITVNTKMGISNLNNPIDFLDARDYLYWSRKAIENSGKYEASRLGQLNTVGPFGTGNLYRDINGNILDGNKVSTAVWSPMFRNPTNQELLGQGWQTMIDPIKTNALGAYDVSGTNKEIIFKDFDYADSALRPQGLTKDLTVSMSGGNDKGSYFASIGSFDEEGLPINTFYKRITFVFNSEYKLKSWITSTSSLNFADAKWRDVATNTEANYLTRSLGAPPTMRGTNANGNLLLGFDNFDGNPVVNDDKFIRKNNSDKFTLTQAFKFDLSKNLSFRASANWFYNLEVNESFNKDYMTSPGNINKTRSTSAAYGRDFSQTYNGVLNYNTSINKHQINAMLGMEFYDMYQNGISASGSGAPSDDFMDLQYTSPDKDKRGIDSYHSENSILSFFTRLNYNYDEKYLLTLTARRDGYSRLLDNRWGNFPGVSMGWKLDKEDFFSSFPKAINTLKLRASYGQNGNVPSNIIGPYSLQGAYGSSKYDGIVGFQLSTLSFPDLRWERSATFEVGLDTRLFSKLDLAVALYNRETQDKISTFSLPATSGITQMTTNLGSMQNRGIEVEVNYNVIKNSNFSLNLYANAAYNTNKILKLPENGLENNRVGGSQVYDKNGNLIWVGGNQEGQDPNVAYAYVAEGIIRTQADLDSYALKLKDLIGYRTLVHPDVYNAMTPTDKGLNFPIALGDVMWKDVNGDGIINTYDREYMGRTVPTTTGGFGFYANYKGFSLSSRLDYALGHVQYDGASAWFMGNTQGKFNTIQDAKNTWTPENPNAKYPSYYWADQLYKNNVNRTSSMFYKKADYLAFREVTLGYSLPSDLLKKIKVEGIKFTLTGQNLGYLSESTLFSPETTSHGTSVGGGYPLPRTVILGVQFIL